MQDRNRQQAKDTKADQDANSNQAQPAANQNTRMRDNNRATKTRDAQDKELKAKEKDTSATKRDTKSKDEGRKDKELKAKEKDTSATKRDTKSKDESREDKRLKNKDKDTKTKDGKVKDKTSRKYKKLTPEERLAHFLKRKKVDEDAIEKFKDDVFKLRAMKAYVKFGKDGKIDFDRVGKITNRSELKALRKELRLSKFKDFIVELGGSAEMAQELSNDFSFRAYIYQLKNIKDFKVTVKMLKAVDTAEKLMDFKEDVFPQILINKLKTLNATKEEIEKLDKSTRFPYKALIAHKVYSRDKDVDFDLVNSISDKMMLKALTCAFKVGVDYKKMAEFIKKNGFDFVEFINFKFGGLTAEDRQKMIKSNTGIAESLKLLFRSERVLYNDETSKKLLPTIKTDADIVHFIMRKIAADTGSLPELEKKDFQVQLAKMLVRSSDFDKKEEADKIDESNYEKYLYDEAYAADTGTVAQHTNGGYLKNALTVFAENTKDMTLDDFYKAYEDMMFPAPIDPSEA